MKRKVKKLVLPAIALLLVSSAVYIIFILSDLPTIEAIGSRRASESTKIYDRTGSVLLYEIYGEERRTIIPFDEIPEAIKNATIAIEDARFYSHPAIDIRSTFRAVWVSLLKGRFGEQGGSTITQQLAKKAFLSDEKTLTRKLKEWIIAFRLEKRYSKDQILELYLNQIPYGSNAYGIHAASITYFDKPPSELSLAEAATLVALPQAPSYYSPWGKHKDDLIARRNLILQRMQAEGFITEEERTRAQYEVVTYAPPKEGIKAPHFVIEVQKYLNEKYGEVFVQTGGLRVITTLDANLQEIAERVVREGVERNTTLYKGTNGALIAEDPKTGQILAMVGSKDYFDVDNDGNFNVASDGLRQPGSAIKPFVYLLAFEKGYTPETIVIDAETEFNVGGNEKNSYKPQNYDEKFIGPVEFKTALAQSRNVPAVKALYLVGIDTFLKRIKEFGIKTLTERSRYGLSLVLGGGEVHLTDLAHTYTTLAANGTQRPQTTILEITQRNKNGGTTILEKFSDNPIEVANPEEVYRINDILSDVDLRSGLFHGSLPLTIFPGYEVALKTGTTNDYRDAWAFGYTPSLVVGVWAGNNDNTPLEKHGGSILAAIPMWNAFMQEALKLMPEESFIRPGTATTQKPILRGEIPSPLHDILHYVDKNNPRDEEPLNPSRDPQYTNWEEGLLAWIAQNPNYNPGYSGGGEKIQILTPQNGTFISTDTYIIAKIPPSGSPRSISLSVNDQIIDRSVINPNEGITYERKILWNSLKPQNKITITTEGDGTPKSESIIVYKQG